MIGLIMAGLSGLASLAGWWAPPLLTFAGANSELIQSLTSLVQLVLWAGAGLIALVGWLWPRQAVPTSTTKTSTRLSQAGSGAVAAGTGAQAAGVGGVVVGRDVQGDVIVVTDPDQLWQRIAQKRPPEELRRATERYLTYLVDRYRYLDFKGMGVSDRVPLRLPLVEMYVPLKARIELPEGETWRPELRLAGRTASAAAAEGLAGRLSEPQPLLRLLQQHDGLIILGDPGAGKTTFLKYLALHLAGGTGQFLGLGARLPILLPLSAYANALAEAETPLDRFIPAYYRERGVDLPLEPLLAEALGRGGALLLLDGLDEVKELRQRETVVKRVVDFFSFHRRAGNKFILTSRIVGYKEVRPTVEGLLECTLWDFEPEEIEAFVSKWTAALERAARGQTLVAAQEAAREQAELLAAVQHNPGVARLAANPLLLTILALMKRQGMLLPERRVQLYQRYVETLLKSWNIARGLDRPASRDLDEVETVRVLAPLALWMHQTSPGLGLVKREELRRQLEQIYAGRNQPQPEQAARQFLADVREHAGLLLERGPEEYGFIHLTFQEYLAAVALAQAGQGDAAAVAAGLEAHLDDDNWHEVTLLTIGYMGLVQQLEQVAGTVVRKLLASPAGQPGQAVALAGEAVVDAWPGGVDPATKERVTQVLVKTMAAERRVKPTWRAAAGAVLARLGDPRPGVGLRPDGRPDIVWREVPAGPFIMGSDKNSDLQAYDDELPPHAVMLPAFKIAQYPVTNAQYAAFVKAGGYGQAGYWGPALAAGAWREGKAIRQLYQYDAQKNELKIVGREEAEAPYDFGSPFNLPNHPVMGLTWYESLAFCAWLTEQLQATGELDSRQVVTLPSEAEWEKAARGPLSLSSKENEPEGEVRLYPWGNEPDPNRANYEASGIGTTSAVGCFPGGASPYGCQEMSGNVWEWTRSLWGKDPMNPEFTYPYDPADGREDQNAGTDVLRVLRGGAFNVSQNFARCAYRFRSNPSFGLGFRVVVSPIL
jgi:formylglycine-generating enzyme required for sulfatase activity